MTLLHEDPIMILHVFLFYLMIAFPKPHKLLQLRMKYDAVMVDRLPCTADRD